MATIERFLPETRARITQLRKDKPPQQLRSTPPQRWLGIALILVSVIGGFLTISRADHRIPVIALKNALAAGQVVGPEDLTKIEVSLRSDLYVTTAEEIVGRTLSADLVAGVVIPIALLHDPEPNNVIAIPVRKTAVPPIARGDRVDIWSQGLRVATDLVISQVAREATMLVISVDVSPEVTPAVVTVLASDFTLVKVS